MEVNAEVEVKVEGGVEDAVAPVATEDEESATDAMEVDESEARRKPHLDALKEGVCDDESEDSIEGVASGSGLIRDPRQPTAGESIRKSRLERHLPVAHIGGARQSLPLAGNNEVEGAHLAKKRRAGESSQIAVRNNESDGDVEVDVTPHPSSSKERYPATASTQPQTARTSTAPVASAIVAPAAPVLPSVEVVADAPVRVAGQPIVRGTAGCLEAATHLSGQSGPEDQGPQVEEEGCQREEEGTSSPSSSLDSRVKAIGVEELANGSSSRSGREGRHVSLKTSPGR
ncbi:hypothetical protein FRB94_004726 [Tulasnella sp. JGI-2019a]|nr:hypothetical protein FRB93_011381 [Tulasnella sp. JGI-2019a]KAG9012916.1 hypothetical protein FRB94_004726 [Tulasnella sp. JGI-2019a]